MAKSRAPNKESPTSAMTTTLSAIEKIRRSNNRFTVILLFLAAKKCLATLLLWLLLLLLLFTKPCFRTYDEEVDFFCVLLFLLLKVISSCLDHRSLISKFILLLFHAFYLAISSLKLVDDIVS
jgi:hypothetical protein